ncbi:MAG: hypothetical protein ACRDH7_07470 [Actinomycetota bacterium]
MRDNAAFYEGFRLRCENKPRPKSGKDQQAGWDAAQGFMNAGGGYGGAK